MKNRHKLLMKLRMGFAKRAVRGIVLDLYDARTDLKGYQPYEGLYEDQEKLNAVCSAMEAIQDKLTEMEADYT